jgi:drug/metabolite transporter (DMT)-like permease
LTVAPFECSFIISSVLWGWLFWSDLPLPSAWSGITLLIMAGLLVVRAGAQKDKAAPEGAA